MLMMHNMEANCSLLIAPVLIDKETKVSPVIPGREGSDSHGVPNGTKLVGNSQLCDKEVTEREPVVGSEQIKNLKDLSIQESPSSSTEKPRISSSQSVNPKLMLLSAEPMRNSKIITAGGNKLCPDKQPAQKKTDISTWKISRNIGGNKSSLNAAPQKQVKSQRSSEQNRELDGNVELKTTQIVDRSEKMPQNLPLKRKTFEKFQRTFKRCC